MVVSQNFILCFLKKEQIFFCCTRSFCLKMRLFIKKKKICLKMLEVFFFDK